MSSTTKILVLNPNPSNLDKVFRQANKLNVRNGPFDATVLLGDVFPKDQNIPNIELQESTYFAQGEEEELSADVSEIVNESSASSSLVDIRDNLILAKPPFSIVKLVTGIVMMITSGPVLEETIEKFTKLNLPQVDVLFTYKWPEVIARDCELLLVGHQMVDELVKIVKPRYHFAVGRQEGKFYELEPFRWPSGEITRFISLGQEGSADKWFYAFNIDGSSSSSSSSEEDTKTINNPFTSKRKLTEDVQNLQSKKTKVAITPDQCFFCLSNPKTETHMIVSIGSHTYFTIAKGPLTRSNRDLPFSGHGIIIPIQHLPCLSSKELEIQQEILRFQDSLIDAFFKRKPFLKLIFFEVNRPTNVHHHVQFIPVYESILNKFETSLNHRVQLNNEKFTRNQKLLFEKFTNVLKQELDSCAPGFIKFTVCLSKDEKETYIAKIQDLGRPIDIQFPRRVLAHMLRLPDRVQWDKCQQSKVKEMQDCEEFKEFYKEFEIA
ncbi:CWF19 family protein [Acetobacter pasteurianus]|nr:CWF19 family protein [Acetobacter pasteurianus]